MNNAINEVTDLIDIDWNHIIKKKKENRPVNPSGGSSYWNKRAPSFADHAGKTLYPDTFLKIMKPRRSWTVLDMGCGGGTLALPLAVKVRHITAVDFSDKMIEILREEKDRRNIENISTIKASWEGDWGKAGIGVYDIAIASRSLAVDDIQAAILKLTNAARKRVYISTVVGDGPFDRRIFEAVGRKFHQSTDYIYIYNLLYQMGIQANISFIPGEKEKKYGSHEDALNSLKWMFQNMTSEEESRLRSYLTEHLIRRNGQWQLNYSKSHKWAVIWWNKQD